jgi:SET domain-containing protein
MASTKPLNYISPSLYIKNIADKGRGVFTSTPFKKNVIIEIAPVIVMTAKDRKSLDETLLHDYIFEWGEKKLQCCMALGYIPLYNHSFQSNCEYEMDFKMQVITIRTVRAIDAEEELFINYNGDWNNNKPIWFSAK